MWKKLLTSLCLLTLAFQVNAGVVNTSQQIIHSVTNIQRNISISEEGEVGIPIPTEVTAYWKCNEATGDLIDALGNNTLTETGTVGTTTGQIDSGRGVFQNSAKYFSSASATPFRNNLFVVEGWIWITDDNINQYVIGTSNHNTGNGWGIHFINNETFQWYANGVGRIDGSSLQSLGLTGKWVYLAVVRYSSAAGGTRLYINNAFNTSGGNGNPIITDTAVLRVGVQQNLANYFKGYIDELAYWDLTGTTKSLADIEAILTERYNAGVGEVYAL